MTTAVAYIDDDGAMAIGADTQVTSGIATQHMVKVVNFGRYVIAVTGPALVLRYFNEAEPVARATDERAPGNIADGLIAWMQERGHTGNPEEGAPDFGFNLLLVDTKTGERHRIYLIGGDGCVIRGTNQMAVGSGAHYAEGAMSALRATGLDADNVVRRALDIAGEHDAYTSGTYVVSILTNAFST